MRSVVPYSNLVDEAEDTDDEPWYVLQADTFFCLDCNESQSFLHVSLRRGQPRIVVFPEKDDSLLLDVATNWQKYGKNPRVVEYDVDFGTCIPIEDVRRFIEQQEKRK